MKSWRIKTESLREILVLPLRLKDFSDAQQLADFMTHELVQENSPWREASAEEGMAVALSQSIFDKELKSAKKKKGQFPTSAEYQNRQNFAEQMYFHPFVHDFFYGDACQHFVRKNPITSLALNAEYGAELGAYSLELKVERCVLTLIPKPGLAILTLEVQADSDSKITRTNQKSFASDKLTLADALSVHDVLRRIHPPYFFTETTWNNLLFPTSVKLKLAEEPNVKNAQPSIMILPDHEQLQGGRHKVLWAPWWQEILGPLVEGDMFTTVVDDRIPSMMFVSSKQASNISRNDKVRLCFADHPDNSVWPYSKNFLLNFEKDHAYERFSHWNTTYFASNYSFVSLTNGKMPVLEEHFRRHYMRMFFLVQMQKAALLTFSTWMVDAMRGNYQASIAQVRKSFVEFTHLTWFSSVSNQEQGRELFHLMQKQSGNLELYAEVKAESESARQELVFKAEHNQAQNTFLLSLFATIFALLTLPIAIWQALDQANYLKAPASVSLLITLAGASFVAFWAVFYVSRSPQATILRLGLWRLTSILLVIFYEVTVMCIAAILIMCSPVQ